MAIELEVVDDDRGAARRAAELIADGRAPRRSAERGIFGCAMSGGRSPWAMLAILGELEEMPWAETELFQVDERIASPGYRGPQPDPHDPRPLDGPPGGAAADAGHPARPRRRRPRIRNLAARAPRPGPPRPRPRRPHRLARPRRPGARGPRPPRRADRDRLPGPPPDDDHLPRARRTPAASSGWSPARTSASRCSSCSPATNRSPPAASATTRMTVVADRAAAPDA